MLDCFEHRLKIKMEGGAAAATPATLQDHFSRDQSNPAVGGSDPGLTVALRALNINQSNANARGSVTNSLWSIIGNQDTRGTPYQKKSKWTKSWIRRTDPNVGAIQVNEQALQLNQRLYSDLDCQTDDGGEQRQSRTLVDIETSDAGKGEERSVGSKPGSLNRKTGKRTTMIGRLPYLVSHIYMGENLILAIE